MAKTETLPAARILTGGCRRHERGMTLFELLITLVIFASLASFTSFALSGTLGHLRHERAVEQLVHDLRQASLEARSQGVSAGIEVTGIGYAVPALNIERVWPAGVTADWRVRRDGVWWPVSQFSLPARTALSPELEVRILSGDEARAVRIDRITGRVHDG